jgi:hypothetical protein
MSRMSRSHSELDLARDAQRAYEDAQAELLVLRRTRDELVHRACRHHDVREVAGVTGLSDSYARKLARTGTTSARLTPLGTEAG